MPDYSQGKIYKIVNDENDNFYIGSTIQPLYKRMYHHRSKDHSCMSKKLGVDIKDCIIVLVENIQCKDKDELLRKERYYIEKYKKEGLNIVNKKIPGRTKKQYYEVNKNYIKKKVKNWVENNKEKTTEYKKQLHQKTYQNDKNYQIKNKCECGALVSKNELNRHIKTKKHLQHKERTIECGCGQLMTKKVYSSHGARHRKTQKHQAHEFLKFIENSNSP